MFENKNQRQKFSVNPIVSVFTPSELRKIPVDIVGMCIELASNDAHRKTVFDVIV